MSNENDDDNDVIKQEKSEAKSSKNIQKFSKDIQQEFSEFQSILPVLEKKVVINILFIIISKFRILILKS